ncbi:hypothetical protein Scep_010128 [Stephania cephalantha]|uniref:Uncharacterized protein n=1 Tax=Stephania cephalantha TaxID=152367 RepID=A0AAP0JWX2_9MAGN
MLDLVLVLIVVLVLFTCDVVTIVADIGSLAFPYAPCRGKADDRSGSCASNLKLPGAMNCWCIMLVRACGWGRWKMVYKWLCLST